MTTPGRALTDPVTGERLTFRHLGPDLLRVEIQAFPGKAVPPAHVHPRFAERFTVLEGALRRRARPPTRAPRCHGVTREASPSSGRERCP